MNTLSTTQTEPLDEQSFRDAFERYAPAVLRYVRARLGEQLAEDATSETFIAAWRARASFDPARGVSVEAWLLGVATNIVARHRRAEARWLRMCMDSAAALPDRSTLEEFADDVDARASTAQQRRNLVHELRRLPHHQRDALLMLTVGELSYEEIATTLELPVGTVKSRINRAREQLRRSVQ